MLLSITSLEFETSAAQEYNNYWWSNSIFPSLSESIHVWESQLHAVDPQHF